MDIAFINVGGKEMIIINILLIIHAYLVIRYCVGNILPRNSISHWTRLTHVMIVALVPFIGYYWVINREDKS